MADVFASGSKQQNDNDDLLDKKKVIKFDLKALLLPIMQKNRRSIFLGTFLLFFHFIMLFSLQFRSSEFAMQNGLMPSIHFVLSKFNAIFLIPDSLKLPIMLVFLGFNFGYGVSMILLGFMGNVNRKNFFRSSIIKFHVYCFQIYNWLILLPSTLLASYLLFSSSCEIYCKALDCVNILMAFIIANFIEYSRININFKCEDALDSRVDLMDKILLNYKILVIFFAGVNFYIDYWLILLYLGLLADYFRKVTFYVENVSIIYLSLVGCFFFAHLLYFASYNNIINLQNVDISYMLFFGSSVIIKTSFGARGYLIIHKLKNIAKNGIRSTLDFDIYIRETYNNLKNFRSDLDCKVLFLSFFAIHQNKCVLKDCACKEVKNNNEASFLKNKKTFKKVVESYFIEYLTNIPSEDFEEVFLMYCSFVSSILKVPSKALNLLLINKARIRTLKNFILIEILMKKSKKSLEKKLLNNDQYAQSFSTVILFDHQVRVVESSIRHILLNELSIGQLLINDNDIRNTALDKFFNLGKDVIHRIENSKDLLKKLFDKNCNNVRLIQMTTLIIKYLSEDLSFRNFYKQLNIKRINQQIIKRKKQSSIDIFENDAGVIFLSLSKKLGLIKKFSKNIAKIFGCDSTEMKNKNMSEFMPLVFARSHDGILNNFVKTGKAVLLVSDHVPLYGISKQNFLMHLILIIRLDTFFTKDFMVGAYVKSMRNAMSKTILLDIHGNFINCSKEVSNYLDFTHLSSEHQHRVSMILLMPDIMEKLLPYNFEDLLLKRNTDFKMKGFLLTPMEVEERYIENISIKDRIYSSFREFQELEDSQRKFQELRYMVASKLSKMVPSDFRFYRIHFTLIVQNFSNNFVNVRLIEIFDIFEIKDMKLQMQYLTRKSKLFKDMMKNEMNHSPLQNSFRDISAEHTPKKPDEIAVKNGATIEKKEDDARLESYISASNRTDVDQKLKSLNDILSAKQGEKSSLNPPSNIPKSSHDFANLSQDFNIKQKGSDFLAVDTISNTHPKNQIPPIHSSQLTIEEDKSNDNEGSSEHQLLLSNQNPKYPEATLKPSLSTIEQEESDLTFDRDGDQDFEEKISLMSNNMMNRESTEEETIDDQATHTMGGSQVSRVSSQASGDGKKSTIDVLTKVGNKKILFLKLLNFCLFLLFTIVTITFFVLIRNETFNLETTLNNSGVFHNQLSPLCILVRDAAIFKFLYSGLFDETTAVTSLITEIKSSMEFNNLLLVRAYKTGIAQADSTVDFVYTTYVNITIENITLYTILLNNSNNPLIQHSVPIKLVEDNLISTQLNIPQCILFFLSAGEHFYDSEILGDTRNATDAYNYMFFLQENILLFIKSMLAVLETNKDKIGGSVSYLNNLNLAFFLIMLFSSLYGIFHSSIISIKSKFKANKFCALFFHFQENEIDERMMKLRHVLDRYFERNNGMFSGTNISNISGNSKSRAKPEAISTDKLNFLLKSDVNPLKKRTHRNYKRSNSIKQIKGKKFQQFLIIFFITGTVLASAIIGIYLSNYISTQNFSANVIEITGDLESVETYVITLHIQYAVNSILLGLYDETSTRQTRRKELADDLLTIVDSMQSQITDLTILFKLSNTDHILTQLKYEFFTKDICELYNFIKENINSQVDEVKEIGNRLKGLEFCQKLLKNVLTKGSTSFAFEINEIFKQWQDFIRNNNFSKNDLQSILKTQEFLDINYALPYVYALGLYDITLMMSTAEKYFESVRSDRLTWFILTLIVVCIIFSFPFQKLIKHLSLYTENAFSLIKLFPYTMISNNKMLENKISRISKQQKI